jgi:hypothetical protein
MTVHVHKSFDWQGAHAALCNAASILDIEIANLQTWRDEVVGELQKDASLSLQTLHDLAGALHAVNSRLGRFRGARVHFDQAHEALEDIRPVEPVIVNPDDCPF